MAWGGGKRGAGDLRCLSNTMKYPLVNKQLDPENHQFLMETSLPTPMTVRVYVNLPEGIYEDYSSKCNVNVCIHVGLPWFAHMPYSI